MWNSRLDNSQAGITIARRYINNLKYADDTILTQKVRRTKEPLDEGEREEWKSCLDTQHSENEDHDIWSHHFMANIWETMETVTEFIFLGSKITEDSDCRPEIKRNLLLERKAVTNLGSILKSRDITLVTKVRLVKAVIFPVVMYEYKCWTIKKAECRRLMLLNFVVGEDSWESLGRQWDQISQSYRKWTLNIHWKDWCWSFNTLAIWCEELAH